MEVTNLLMVFLEEVKFLFQAIQISPQRGDDLLVVGLGLFQSDTVSLHRLTHHQLSLPPGQVQKNTHLMLIYLIFLAAVEGAS